MKATKELLILAMPLMILGCSGNGTSSSTPSTTAVDAQGFYVGTAQIGANVDSMLGIVTADGTADFLEFTGDYTNLSAATKFIVLAPKQVISADESGNYTVPYLGYSGNGYVLPSPSDGFSETGVFAGKATAATSLVGSYSVTGPISSNAAVLQPNADATIVYNIGYQASAYEAPASASIAAGSYTVAIIVGTSQYSASLTITDQGSGVPASVSGFGTDNLDSGCNFSGTATIPDPSRNAYEFSLSSSGAGCPLAFGNLSGVASLLSISNTTVMLTILSETGTQQGVLMLMSQDAIG